MKALLATLPAWRRFAQMLIWCAACGFQALPSAAQTGQPQASTKVESETKKAKPKIYKYLQGGTASFSDVPPARQSYVVYRPSCFACDVASGINWEMTRLHLDAYAQEISLASHQFGIDQALVRAVIHAESGFNALARSPKGAIGLMQVMPRTAMDMGVADARSPRSNIRAGAQYLSTQMQRFKNNVTLATAAYNAGPEAVQRYAGVPPYAETQVYVQRVEILRRRYQQALRE